MTEESLLQRQQHLSVIVAAAAIVSVYITHSINIRQIAVIPTQQLRVMTVLIHVSTVVPLLQLTPLISITDMKCAMHCIISWWCKV